VGAIGALHLAEMRRYKDPVELELMTQVKCLLDPAALMNPGRVVPPATPAGLD
jgi:D-lactate dehydrogenase (cytochrome)